MFKRGAPGLHLLLDLNGGTTPTEDSYHLSRDLKPYSVPDVTRMHGGGEGWALWERSFSPSEPRTGSA